MNLVAGVLQEVLTMSAAEHEMVARRAYRLWEERGCPFGSPEVDWYKAQAEWEAQHTVMPPLMGMAFGPGWSEDERRAA